MITVEWWMLALALVVVAGLAFYVGVYLGHRRGYHQGYWARIIQQASKKDPQ